ncbi:hypothetical protein [Halorussus sp. MSC15.2]|uniref:hypothetical protein n=1 Tax=Halorussus sp. MSC15.2 TaxID=2283638 RepID=UPI0013D000ED|nr:hypothetical protein [Halorussus sp. MSC15.2]NEU57107.1 hypothetical protein [Halorussus sp. MSC15.2]
MADHTEVRLEKPRENADDDVVAYFAPNFEVQPSFDNDLFTAERATSRPTVARDNQQYSHELSVEGVFEDSDRLPDAHRADVEAMVGSSPATARQQVNRLVHYATQVGGPFYLYEGTDEYTAESTAAMDVQNGVYPAVQIASVEPPSQGGLSRFEYSVQFVVGVPR